MVLCEQCGLPHFNTKGVILEDYTHGLKKGKTFVLRLCPTCRKSFKGEKKQLLVMARKYGI